MKKHLTFHFFLFFLVLLTTACEKDSSRAAQENPLRGNVTTPAWSVGSDYDYTNSMTAVVSVLLMENDSTQADEKLWSLGSDDMLGAFVGDECVGVARPSGNLFFLFIVSGADHYKTVKLRYYSARLRNIFYTDIAFPFINNGQQGTVSDPMSVQFRLSDD